MRVQAVSEAMEHMSLNRALALCGMSKRAWHHAGKPRDIRVDPQTAAAVRRAASERPTYGTRRMAAQIARETGMPTSRKRIQRTCRKMGWIEPKKGKNETVRASRRKMFRPEGPGQLWETDITCIHCGADGWRCCFNMLDVFTRQWLAYLLDTAATAGTAVQSVLVAVSTAGGSAPPGLRLRTDNGPQYGSRESGRSVRALGIRHESVWKNTPEQNGHTRSFHGTPRREYVWPHEFARIQEAEEVLARAFADYNGQRIHSALGYATPDKFAIAEGANK